MERDGSMISLGARWREVDSVFVELRMEESFKGRLIVDQMDLNGGWRGIPIGSTWRLISRLMVCCTPAAPYRVAVQERP